MKSQQIPLYLSTNTSLSIHSISFYVPWWFNMNKGVFSIKIIYTHTVSDSWPSHLENSKTTGFPTTWFFIFLLKTRKGKPAFSCFFNPQSINLVGFSLKVVKTSFLYLQRWLFISTTGTLLLISWWNQMFRWFPFTLWLSLKPTNKQIQGLWMDCLRTI